jgi:hypothetical protein
MGRREWDASEALNECISLMQVEASEVHWIESYGGKVLQVSGWKNFDPPTVHGANFGR